MNVGDWLVALAGLGCLSVVCSDGWSGCASAGPGGLGPGLFPSAAGVQASQGAAPQPSSPRGCGRCRRRPCRTGPWPRPWSRRRQSHRWPGTGCQAAVAGATAAPTRAPGSRRRPGPSASARRPARLPVRVIPASSLISRACTLGQPRRHSTPGHPQLGVAGSVTRVTPDGRLARTSPNAQAASTSAMAMIATAYGPVTTAILASVRVIRPPRTHPNYRACQSSPPLPVEDLAGGAVPGLPTTGRGHSLIEPQSAMMWRLADYEASQRRRTS
jgi:hypothetical protein